MLNTKTEIEVINFLIMVGDEVRGEYGSHRQWTQISGGC
jgi:hypothetical protein